MVAISIRLLLSAGVLLVSLAPSYLRAQETLDADAVERGRQQYSANCTFCHGLQNAGGGVGPNLFRSKLVTPHTDSDAISAVLKNGRPDKGMPAFSSFSARQTADLVAFLQAKSRENRGGLSETALLVGDAKAGQAYFNGAGKCSTCHSSAGDLAHVGSKYEPLALASAFLTPKPNSIQKVTVTLPSGESLTGKLQYLDEFNVSMDDASGNYHSWPRNSVKSVDVSDPLAAHAELLGRYTDTEIHNLLAYLATLK
jgi:cytochrome c oxidase cbb3-type subunit 3